MIIYRDTFLMMCIGAFFLVPIGIAILFLIINSNYKNQNKKGAEMFETKNKMRKTFSSMIILGGLLFSSTQLCAKETPLNNCERIAQERDFFVKNTQNQEVQDAYDVWETNMIQGKSIVENLKRKFQIASLAHFEKKFSKDPEKAMIKAIAHSYQKEIKCYESIIN